MKNLVMVLLLLFLSIALKAQKTSTIVKVDNLFVQGLKSASLYSKVQAENGSEYNYSCGRTFTIKFFFEQVDIFFYAINENEQKKQLDTKFEVGYSSIDNEMLLLKDSIKFLVGQYDFDADDIDELVIALQDNDEAGNGLTINIFKLKNDNWLRIGTLTGKTILGTPIAEVKMNKVTIKRNLRGFFYQWTFESGKFKDTSDL